MANIELPKDAEGREIPLNTAFLYDNNGQAYEVRTYYCAVDEDMPDRKWEALLFSRGSAEIRSIRTTALYLTPPDSWKKLEEDLSGISKGTVCHYFHKGDSKTCEGCPARTGSCWHTIARDIASRIRKLRGEDDA